MRRNYFPWFLVGVALTWFHLMRLGWSVVAPAPAGFVEAVAVDPNTAAVGELTSLPGIGRTLAARIVLHRLRHGRFEEVRDLVAVDGIGESTVARIAPFLAIAPSGSR